MFVVPTSVGVSLLGPTKVGTTNPWRRPIMGLTKVTAKIISLERNAGEFEALFLVDTGATDSLVPENELRSIGVQPRGQTAYELADGSVMEYAFGLARIEFMGEVTAGRVIFGPADAEPILGVTALESVGILVDPANKTLTRLPAIPLKSVEAKEECDVAHNPMMNKRREYGI
jgi:clan AA aspartic protease